MIPGDIAVTELTSAAILVYLLEVVKSLPWVQQKLGSWSWLYRVASILWALVSTIVLSYEFSGNAVYGWMTASGFTALGGVALGLWHWIEQFAMQEIIYRATSHDFVVNLPQPAATASTPQAGPTTPPITPAGRR